MVYYWLIDFVFCRLSHSTDAELSLLRAYPSPLSMVVFSPSPVVLEPCLTRDNYHERISNLLYAEEIDQVSSIAKWVILHAADNAARWIISVSVIILLFCVIIILCLFGLLTTIFVCIHLWTICFCPILAARNLVVSCSCMWPFCDISRL